MATINVHLNNLPSDIIYQLFSHLTNIDDINNFSLSSKLLFRTVNDRISRLSLDNITLIPIEVILRYRNINSINNVYIVVNKSNIELAKRLPQRANFNFYLEDICSIHEFEQMTINILEHIKDSTINLKMFHMMILTY